MGLTPSHVTIENVSDYSENTLTTYVTEKCDMSSKEFMIILKRYPELIKIKPSHVKYSYIDQNIVK